MVRIDPTACVESPECIGDNTYIWHFSHIREGAEIGSDSMIGQSVYVASGVKIGQGCRIQNNVSLYDGVILDDYVFVGPSAVFTNVTHPRSFINQRNRFKETRVGKGVTIGANATILCGVTIGDYSFIGAGSVVTKDVAAHSLVKGNPAKLSHWVCYCGHKLIQKMDQRTEVLDESEWECVGCGTLAQTRRKIDLETQVEAFSPFVFTKISDQIRCRLPDLREDTN